MYTNCFIYLFILFFFYFVCFFVCFFHFHAWLLQLETEINFQLTYSVKFKSQY